ncbi:vacuolar membrane protein Pep3p [[Candida] anglica]|uniref:Vacuolar membrane protein Pep3p n=1 Tax=[Candida] anglica TaxID=148631 RepID=A0ABP0EGP5_9ASCO
MTLISLDEKTPGAPVVDVEPVQLQFDVNGSLQRLLVQNDIMYLILTSSVYRIDLSNPSEVRHVELVQQGGSSLRITNAWLHPNGAHLICQVNHTTYYYLNESYVRFKILPRFKGLKINCMAFPDGDRAVSGDFLSGTKDGAVYICSLKSHDPSVHESKRDDKYVKQAYQASSSQSGNTSVSQLMFSKDDSLVVALVGDSLYTWSVAGHSYQVLIKSLKTTPTTVKIGQAIFTTRDSSYTIINPSTNAIYTNDQDLNLAQVDKFPVSGEDGLSHSPALSSVISTRHYLMALSTKHDKIHLLAKLSNDTTSSHDLTVQGKVIGITADNTANTYWLYTHSNIYEVVLSNESSAVWYNYYQMGMYEEALTCLEKNSANASKRDLVLIKSGYNSLQKGGFGIDYSEDIDPELFLLQVKGIRILAQSSEPFEKVCLMLMSLQHDGTDLSSTTSSTDARTKSSLSEKLLVEYLLVKFQQAKLEKNKIRTVVLSSWIIEMMLRLVYKKEEENSKFESFLASNYKHLDSKTVYQIIMGYNYPSKLIYYAELIEDFEFILNYYVDLEDWTNSLKTLVKIYTDGDRELIFKKATVLLVNAPKATVDIWLKFNELDYEKLLPAILTYNKNNINIKLEENQTIKFLSRVIYDKGVKNKIINNYFLCLLVTYPTEDKEQVNRYMVKVLKRIKQDGSSQAYDANFILRQCLQNNHYHPAIIILINDMQLFEQALELSLDYDLTELAQFVLRKYDDYLFDRVSKDEDMFEFTDHEQDLKFVGKVKIEEESFSSRKKLWTMFSKYLINGVCNGKSFAFLDDMSSESEDIKTESETEKESKSKGKPTNSISDITSGLVESMTNGPTNNSIKFNSSKISCLLKYLLSASYDSKTNSNVLSLKDLLPLFPESVMINNFKTEIIQSLNQYNSKINQLSYEMQESLNISQALKKQVRESQETSNKGRIHTVVEPGEPCQLCGELLVNKAFVCFPNCQHCFHKECLVKSFLKSKGDYRFKKIFHNFKRNPTSTNREELDDLLLKECVLCSEGNINTIDDNIIDLESDKKESEKWDL